ncbi:helix-turn-helix domain-containing protein [Staphylococcus sp. 17KM0847]|uniref:helix-turn-helix domain-containing protein n=1 Tax=Staphylococcus sp. 17KM0847 TaxID=2583989 RepID=UPI0015DC3837|nr:helix-turn-helix domain-containing protein [Staphylococcus sp. 17KM0847]QLK86125.1 hypothetical protein FGL66_05060 [Staphylococcus sp. 17KM0847]
MKSIITFAYQHANPHKSKKSIFNIITGKKSHQTFFDATSLEMLSLYGCAPTLTYDNFESIIKSTHPHISLPLQNHAPYAILQQTFTALQLLIQTLSYAKHGHMSFVPITSQIAVHQTVRRIYHHFHLKTHIQDVEDELYLLFQCLNAKHENSTAHYYLTGYDEAMYTTKQVSLVTQQDMTTLTQIHYTDIVYLYDLLRDNTQFPILTYCLMHVPLSHTLMRTFVLLNQGRSIHDIAEQTHRTENTIHDHILALFIHNYIQDYTPYLMHNMIDFIQFYNQHPYQKLRFYKENFEHLSYFEIKLAIIGIAKGDLHA